MIKASVSTYGLPFIVINGLKYFLESEKNPISEFEQLDEFIDKAAHFDLLIVGLTGELDPLFEAHLAQHHPNVLLILLSERTADVKQLVTLGIQAIVNWDCPQEEIITALQMASKGKKYICDRLLDRMFTSGPGLRDKALGLLSDREMEILQQIGRGHTTHEIADSLYLSMHTVNSHRQNILRKLNLKNPPQLITYAWQAGLMNSD